MSIRTIPNHSASTPGTTTLEMTQDIYDAIAVAVEVAFDDEEAVPGAHREAAAELWSFFAAGTTVRHEARA